MLDDEELASELRLHLQNKGGKRKAKDIIAYLEIPEVQARFGLKEAPCLKTAQRWLRLNMLDETTAQSSVSLDTNEDP